MQSKCVWQRDHPWIFSAETRWTGHMPVAFRNLRASPRSQHDGSLRPIKGGSNTESQGGLVTESRVVTTETRVG